MDGTFILIVMAIFMAVVFYCMARNLDHERIGQYVEARGGKVLDLKRAPFGTEWLGEGNESIYHIRYVDRDGSEHEARCKTSSLTDVYFTEDRIVKNGRYEDVLPSSRQDSLEAENRRLREELERLRRRADHT